MQRAATKADIAAIAKRPGAARIKNANFENASIDIRGAGVGVRARKRQRARAGFGEGSTARNGPTQGDNAAGRVDGAVRRRAEADSHGACPCGEAAQRAAFQIQRQLPAARVDAARADVQRARVQINGTELIDVAPTIFRLKSKKICGTTRNVQCSGPIPTDARRSISHIQCAAA